MNETKDLNSEGCPGQRAKHPIEDATVLLMPGKPSIVYFVRIGIRNDGDLFNFIDRVKHFGFDYAWQLLLEDQPERLRQRQLDQHRRKTVKQLRKKKDLDAYYAGLVAERKKRLGW